MALTIYMKMKDFQKVIHTPENISEVACRSRFFFVILTCSFASNPTEFFHPLSPVPTNYLMDRSALLTSGLL
jgi:hypothetical protein